MPNKPAPNNSSEDSNKANREDSKQGISNRDLREEDKRQSKVIPFPSERKGGRGREGRDESSLEEE